MRQPLIKGLCSDTGQARIHLSLLGQGAPIAENDREIFICFSFRYLECFHVTFVKVRIISQCVIFHRKSNRLSLDPVSCALRLNHQSPRKLLLNIQLYLFARVCLSNLTAEAADLLTFNSCC